MKVCKSLWEFVKVFGGLWGISGVFGGSLSLNLQTSWL